MARRMAFSLKALRVSLFVVLGVQGTQFLLQCFAFQNPPLGTRPVVWDEHTYVTDAQRLFADYGSASMRAAYRQLYSFVGVLILKLTGIDFSASSLTMVLFCLTLFIAAMALYILCRSGKVTTLGALLLASTLLSITETATGMSTAMADVYAGASVLLLMASSVWLAQESAPIRLVTFFVAVALALHTKPVTVVVAVAYLGAVVASRVLRVPTAYDKAGSHPGHRQAAWLFGLVVCACAVALLPTNMIKFWQDMVHHNEILGYWTHYHTMWNNVGFACALLMESLSFTQLTALLLGASLTWVTVRAQRTPRPIDKEFIGFVWYGVPLAVVLMFSMGVKGGKDARSCYFLVVMLLTLYFGATSALWSWQCRGLALANVLVAINLLAQAGGSAESPGIFQAHLLPSPLHIGYNVFDSRTVKTSQGLGIDQVLQTVCEDRPTQTTLSLFVPHSTLTFNADSFLSYWETSRPLLSACRHVQTFSPSSATFRYGGWQAPGGIPGAFFDAAYIVTIDGLIHGHLEGGTELYNEQIASALTQRDANFLSGLSLLRDFENAYGQHVNIYRRDKAPTSGAFKAIVEQLARADGPNAWNIPYLAALGKGSAVVAQQVATMSLPRFWETISYARDLPTGQRTLLADCGEQPDLGGKAPLHVDEQRRIVYNVPDCNQKLLDDRFFMHVFPKGGDTYKNLDFFAKDYRGSSILNARGEICTLRIPLPNEHFSVIRIGQFKMPDGACCENTWEVVLPDTDSKGKG